jgi:hypothetical protein
MKTRAQLQQEIDHLRDRLGEAEAALQAIHSGEIDALVVVRPGRADIYVEVGHPYRVMVEHERRRCPVLRMGAFFTPTRFGGMLGEPVETLIGSSLDYIAPEDILILKVVEQAFKVRPVRSCVSKQRWFYLPPSFP